MLMRTCKQHIEDPDLYSCILHMHKGTHKYNIQYVYVCAGMHAYIQILYLFSLLLSCAQGDWMRFCFDYSIDLKVLNHCGELHFQVLLFFTLHQIEKHFKSTRLLLCSSVWLNPVVWKQGTLPEHTCTLNPPDSRASTNHSLNASLVNRLTFTSKYKQQLIQVKSP